MDIQQLDFSKLPFSRLFNHYIKGNKDIQPFYSSTHDYQALKDAVNSYTFKGDRSEMARLISSFNAAISNKTSGEKLQAILEDENTVTITTGQQLSLFGGPLYTIYKTLTVIHLARRLERDTGKKVIPVFWLADEDHDFEEISSVAIPDSDNLRKIALPCEVCARHAAGSIRVDEHFESFRSEVYQSLQPTDFHDELISLLDDAYAGGRTYRDAFGVLLSRLFSRHGLIFAGSNYREAKQFSVSCIRDAVINASAIRSSLEDQTRRLGKSYHQQVQVTDSLLFWHDDEYGRVRLRHENGEWKRDPNVTYSKDELLFLVDSEPERFSPNVFLRPVIQDTILPNVGYVGGPAEIAYYGQMKPVYDHFGLRMPFIAARLSATLVEPAVQRFLGELPFDFPDYLKRFEDLEQHFLRTHGNPGLDDHFDAWKQKVDALTATMVEQIGITDPGLLKHSKAVTREHLKSIDKLKKKMLSSIRQKEEVQTKRIKKVKNAVFPNEKLQEREISFIYFLNKFGMDLFDRMLEELDTFDEEEALYSSHHIIKL